MVILSSAESQMISVPLQRNTEWKPAPRRQPSSKTIDVAFSVDFGTMWIVHVDARCCEKDGYGNHGLKLARYEVRAG